MLVKRRRVSFSWCLVAPGVKGRGGASEMKLNGSLFRRWSISYRVKTSVDIRH